MIPIARFVRLFGAKRALDKVAVRKRTREGGKTRVLCLLLGCLTDVSISERERKVTHCYILR